LQATARLNQIGCTVVVATNQSGVGRGYYTEETLQHIHEKMERELDNAGGYINAIFHCPHVPDDHCYCRKPKPGMLQQIAKQFNTDLSDALLVGDSLRDIQAAHAANCRAVLVKTGKGERTLADASWLTDVPVYDDLASLVEAILLL
jgi:D-glycero-D-manno-heptose 1,7-bisphosphate phosphatase